MLQGSAVRCDGKSASLTAPNGKAQREVISAAFAVAQIAPSALTLMEAHGTGTALGDPMEVGSVTAVVLKFRDNSATPMAIGSMKANAGHAEPGAGFSGLLKLIVGLAWGDAAPNAQLHVLNPHLGSTLKGVSCALTVQLLALPANARVGGVSSFGYSGTIAHAVLRHSGKAAQKAPPKPKFKRRIFQWIKPTDSTKAADSVEGCVLMICEELNAFGKSSTASVLRKDLGFAEFGLSARDVASFVKRLNALFRTRMTTSVLLRASTPQLLGEHAFGLLCPKRGTSEHVPAESEAAPRHDVKNMEVARIDMAPADVRAVKCHATSGPKYPKDPWTRQPFPEPRRASFAATVKFVVASKYIIVRDAPIARSAARKVDSMRLIKMDETFEASEFRDGWLKLARSEKERHGWVLYEGHQAGVSTSLVLVDTSPLTPTRRVTLRVGCVGFGAPGGGSIIASDLQGVVVATATCGGWTRVHKIDQAENEEPNEYWVLSSEV